MVTYSFPLIVFQNLPPWKSAADQKGPSSDAAPTQNPAAKSTPSYDRHPPVGVASGAVHFGRTDFVVVVMLAPTRR